MEKTKEEIIQEQESEKEKKNVVIGARLKHLLEINSLSTEDVRQIISKNDVINKAELKESTFKKYLHDIRRPTLETLVIFSRLFNTSVDYIIEENPYLLDTWGFEFLDELVDYSSEKIEDHFEKKYDKSLKGLSKFDLVLYGMLMSSKSGFGESLANTPSEEEKIRLEYVQKIIKAVNLMISLNNLDEVSNIVDKLDAVNSGTFSFTTDDKLEQIEKSENLSKEEKVDLLETMLLKNNEHTNKMLEIIKEMRESD